MAAGGPGRGRGAIIAKLLELEQRPGPPTSSSTAGGSPPVQEAVQVPLPRSSGRGAILRRIQQIQAETITNRNQQTPITPTPQPADPLDQPPVPRGRGKLLMTLGFVALMNRTISRPDKLRSIVQKIALQINCKLGGALWAVKIPFAKAMICGIDTYHDTKNRAQSVAGFVASLNPNVTRWHSQVFMQSSNREMVDGLRTALAIALQKYSEVRP
ncbi:Piwi-like protein 2 [Homalodisca vitripennis]|nr:Piwi-like protein 2 [Homalodisca vitripennis]